MVALSRAMIGVGGAGRRRDAVEGRDLVVRHAGLDHGGQVGGERRAGAARHRERAQPALADQRQQDGDALEGHLDLAAEHGGDEFAAALVGHADDVDAGRRLEQLAGHMRQAAGAGMRVVELARTALRVGDELARRTSPGSPGGTTRI